MSRLKGGSAPIGVPAIRISPAVGGSKPAIIRSVVVFPEPEAPSSVRNSPAAISRESSSTARKSPNRFEMRRSSRIGIRLLRGLHLDPDVLVLFLPRAQLTEI